MSITLRLPAPLRELARGRGELTLPAPADNGVITVGDAFAALRRDYRAVYDRIMTEQGELRPHINVFVGSESIRSGEGIATTVPDGSEIVILPAVSGGAGHHTA